jgi:hypothetical protein
MGDKKDSKQSTVSSDQSKEKEQGNSAPDLTTLMVNTPAPAAAEAVKKKQEEEGTQKTEGTEKPKTPKAKKAAPKRNTAPEGVDYPVKVCVGCRSKDLERTGEKGKGWEKFRCRRCTKVQKFAVTG